MTPAAHPPSMVALEVEHVIDVEAPQDAVWAVTEDVERWPEWLPTVVSVRRLDHGPFDVESAARIKQPGLPETTWVVTALTRGERFTWSTRVRGMRMVASHELTATPTGTRSLLRLAMYGLVARVLWPLARLSVRRTLKRENECLKRRCEAEAAPTRAR